MEEKKNKYLAVAYKLYVDDNGVEIVAEEAPADKPFQLISGFGFALDDFEKNIVDLEKGATFDFRIAKEQAYGEHFADRIVDLDKQIFVVDGKFDADNIFEGAFVPLQNENGQRFIGKVIEVGDDKVKLDMNHPFAGKDLHFTGTVVESREATNEEIQNLINHMSGGCGGNCSGCGGSCGEGCGDGCGGHEGGCGHCH